jgi:hypothetical protein
MSSHPRTDAAKKALQWLGIVVLAILPFPWW